MQFSSVPILFGTLVMQFRAENDSFFFVFVVFYVLCCHIAVFCIRADSVIGDWMLN
jgi:hypothetical protein